MSTALKISVNACCVNSASTLTNDPWINETMRRVCVRTNLQCNGQEMVCFCFLFGGPKAPDPAGRRPLNERLKTLRPGVERTWFAAMATGPCPGRRFYTTSPHTLTLQTDMTLACFETLASCMHAVGTVGGPNGPSTGPPLRTNKRYKHSCEQLIISDVLTQYRCGALQFRLALTHSPSNLNLSLLPPMGHWPLCERAFV